MREAQTSACNRDYTHGFIRRSRAAAQAHKVSTSERRTCAVSHRLSGHGAGVRRVRRDVGQAAHIKGIASATSPPSDYAFSFDLYFYCSHNRGMMRKKTDVQSRLCHIRSIQVDLIVEKQELGQLGSAHVEWIPVRQTCSEAPGCTEDCMWTKKDSTRNGMEPQS